MNWIEKGLKRKIASVRSIYRKKLFCSIDTIGIFGNRVIVNDCAGITVYRVIAACVGNDAAV